MMTLIAKMSPEDLHMAACDMADAALLEAWESGGQACQESIDAVHAARLYAGGIMTYGRMLSFSEGAWRTDSRLYRVLGSDSLSYRAANIAARCLMENGREVVNHALQVFGAFFDGHRLTGREDRSLYRTAIVCMPYLLSVHHRGKRERERLLTLLSKKAQALPPHAFEYELKLFDA